MATKAKTTKVSHVMFWQLLKMDPEYKESEKEIIKSGTVMHYSKGRTSSLSEMYRQHPKEYCLMIEALKKQNKEAVHDVKEMELDKARKRVIAAICKSVDKRGYKFATPVSKLDYVKRIACKGANCFKFNAIPLSRLQQLYSDWKSRNEVDINGNAELDYILSGN